MPSRIALPVLCLLLLAACGDEATRAPGDTLREPGVQGKPVPALGSVQCAIVERPAPDRAVVEATWTLGPDAEGCELELGLPEGAVLVEGELAVPVPPGATSGRTRWTVGFPTGRPLDAVIRLCGTLDQGLRITECYARLAGER